MGVVWVLVAWAHAIRAELAKIAPQRDKASDGAIGDLAHQGSPSGHNPDETGNAERRDADNKNEVRAIDIDADLNVPGLTMAMVVAYLVGRCRAGLEKRLIYIIFRGVIWSASSGWKARKYTGSNPHNKHAHLSGHPDGDEDGRPFGLASLMPKPAPPKPKPAPVRPAPGPVVAFPLPTGHYFGPKNGPDRSVSGYYGRKFGGKLDRDWLKAFAAQLGRRGWAVGKGKRWLGRYGNNGEYGAEYRALVRAWQADQRLPVTGLVDRRTWDAAYRNPIT